MTKIFNSMEELKNSGIELVKEISADEYINKFVDNEFISEVEKERRYNVDLRFYNRDKMVFLEDGHVFCKDDWNGVLYDNSFNSVVIENDGDFEKVGYEVEVYSKPSMERFTIDINF